MQMIWQQYYSESEEGVAITPEQASAFAKDVAGDFNPIHDEDARRFCVPGDMLFAILLERFGLYQTMFCRFHNMVGRQARLQFVEAGDGRINVVDRAGKLYLEATHEGRRTLDPAAIADFSRRYVAFSGHNFPHYLKPLMEKHGVMFNPERPLVIYDSMGFSLQSLDVAGSDITFGGASMSVDGKRAEANLEFVIQDDGQEQGTGSKKLLIGGLRPYDAEIMDQTTQVFYKLRTDYEARRGSTSCS